ncbi:peptidoglycan-associated lipoprotein Pal [Yunchengibacter salinarum]|uniref:peptidoglycan-associated lipoprotein Pal n=1 Tax=Yunchengibacter salinarum TaxID=3133399 RepID=UPI0035B596CD
MTFNHLGTKITKQVFTVSAAALLVAACSSSPDREDVSTDSGAAPSQTETESTTPAPDQVDTPEMTQEELDREKWGGPSQEGLSTYVGDRVFFDFDSSELDQKDRDVLEKQAEWLMHYTDMDVTIEGHCDERGTREYNLALGERRANAVKEYLMALGVPASRLDTISYGKERPAVVGTGPEVWSQNRRGVLRVE